MDNHEKVQVQIQVQASVDDLKNSEDGGLNVENVSDDMENPNININAFGDANVRASDDDDFDDDDDDDDDCEKQGLLAATSASAEDQDEEDKEPVTKSKKSSKTKREKNKNRNGSKQNPERSDLRVATTRRRKNDSCSSSVGSSTSHSSTSAGPGTGPGPGAGAGASDGSVQWSLDVEEQQLERRLRKRRQRQRQRERQQQSLLFFVTATFIIVTMIWIGFVISSYRQDKLNKSNTNNDRHPVPNENDDDTVGSNGKSDFGLIAVDPHQMVPTELLQAGIYKPSDFVNERGVRVPYWRENNSRSYGPCYSTDQITNPITWNSKEPSDDIGNNNNNHNETRQMTFIYRQQLVQRNKQNNKKNSAEYWEQFSPTLGVGGGCRPGFIILGAGKCGTSSLYHYLTAHPRVAPAFEKQIHYFKYHTNLPLSWYYSWFPTTQSFLQNGMLMTGEASPGYLPYPTVVREMERLLPGQPPPKLIILGRNPLERMYSSFKYNYVQPTIDALQRGRIWAYENPDLCIDTNEVTNSTSGPDSDSIKTSTHTSGRLSRVRLKQHQNESYYQPYLFTMEELVRAELTQLKECLGYYRQNRHRRDVEDEIQDGEEGEGNNEIDFVPGFGPNATYDLWYKKNRWTRHEFDRRRQQQRQNDDQGRYDYPIELIDIDGVCFTKGKKSKGKSKSSSYMKLDQWAELQEEFPYKVVAPATAFLTQALIGRSLYVLPMEWWYSRFSNKRNYGNKNNDNDGDDDGDQRITFVCTEEINQPNFLNDLATDYLGLPHFDFTDTIATEGAYNVGGHRGYDEATSWDVIHQEVKEEEEEQEEKDENREHKQDEQQQQQQERSHYVDVIPLSFELRQEVLEFIQPYNERLFQLVGKRCNSWTVP